MTIRVHNEGWDNLVYIANNEVVFRIPRNELSRRQLQVELHFLPQIAEVSPLAVPEYQYFSKQTGLYAGYDLLPGEQFTAQMFETCSSDEKRHIAKQIGAFLSALHSFPLHEKDLQAVPVQKQSRQSWLDLWAEVYHKAADILQSQHREKIERMFSYILDEMDFDMLPKTLIHGDFSSDHLLFNETSKQLSGVIDFGDLMIGDPAYDFNGILREYWGEFLQEVLQFYQPGMDDKYKQRITRFYQAKIPLHGLLVGIERKDQDMIQQNFLGL
jgi:aminoglycoside 2''-phosphotransferase